jgi:peptidoglycan/xylan/chitin deacetylase (PgdA/CDA1 family)
MLLRIARIFIDIISAVIHPVTKITGRYRIRILSYHRIYHLTIQTHTDMNIMCVEPDQFEKQMAYLAGHDYHVITLAELFETLNSKRELMPNTIVITFDDGYRDNYINAFPILNSHMLKGTFFLVTDYIDQDGIFPWLKLDAALQEEYKANKEYWQSISIKEIGEMADYGHCFGSHTRSHVALASFSVSDAGTLQTELNGSLSRIEQLVEPGVRCFCYPFGSLSEVVKQKVIEAGYDIAVCSMGGSNDMEDDRYALKRIIIENTDSLSRFVRKIDGAYDWWYGRFLPLVIRLKNV